MSKIPVAAGMVLALLLGAAASQARPARERAGAARAAGAEARTMRPRVTFEPNRGQAPARADYIARSERYTAGLQSHRVVVRGPSTADGATPTTTTLVLTGARRDVAAAAGGRLPSHSNYLLGSSPGKWVTGVPHYSRVAYEDVYPGIDVAYHGDARGLEFDFIVAPGADARSIGLAYPHARSLHVTAGGALAVQQGQVTTTVTAPVAYQVVDGRRRRVEAAFRVAGHGVRFDLGGYDESRPLVIDPVLDYSTFLGGIKTDIVYDVAVDDEGNAYATGRTGSVNFPVVDPWQSERAGDADVFVSKFSPAGELVYSTFIGGEGYDVGFSLALRPNGGFYVTGVTCSREYPTKNAVQKNVNGRCDALLTRMSKSGSKLKFSTYVGGSGTDRAEDVAYGEGGVFVIGETTSKNELRSPIQNKYGGGLRDAFIARLEGDGDRYKYFTYLGGKGVDRGRSITLDEDGRAYVTGFTDSTNFPTKKALQPKKKGPKEADDFSAADAFIASLNRDGTKLKWSTFFGGGRGEIAYTIELDPDGKPWIGGRSQSKNLPTTAGAYQPETGGGDEGDGMLLKLNRKGSKLLMCTYFGGSGHDRIYDFALDSNGVPAIAGRTDSPNFPLMNALQPAFAGGTSDAYMARFTSAGATALEYSTYLGGSDFDRAFAVAAGPSGIVVAGGETRSPDFLTGNAGQPSYGGGLADGFVTRLSP